MARPTSNFRPMLSPGNSPADTPTYFSDLKFPLMCSPKLDGIRCIVKQDQRVDYTDFDGEPIPCGDTRAVCKSRKFIDLPSVQVQTLFSGCLEADGELIAGCETDFNVYNRTNSHVMSSNKPHEDMKYRVFDWADEAWADTPFILRYQQVIDMVKFWGNPHVTAVEHTLIDNTEDLQAYEEEQLALGYEGIMWRDPNGRYKHNRGTWKEGLIGKLKRFADEELIATGFIEGKYNTNEDVRDNLGGAKRSTSKEGMVASGMMGKIVAMWNGVEIHVASGIMTHAQKKHVWENQDQYLGRIFTMRHFPHGKKDLPRMPRFHGWRNPIDIGEM